MIKSKRLELTVGIFVILGLAALLFLALKVSGLTQLSETEGYRLVAVFDNVGDLKPRAPVTIAGVQVGAVKTIQLNPKTYRGIVTLHINKGVKLPDGTTASIFTQGLLGNNYVSLTPGYEEKNLEDGAVIRDTNPALILENLIGQLIFNTKQKK